MKRILFIAAKDLRRLRAWIWLWAGLFVGHAGLGFYAIHGEVFFDSRLRAAIETLNRALMTTEGALCFVLALLWTREDGVLRTTEFWRTRPIAPSRMLLGKFAGLLAVIVGLPVIVALPWWWFCGFAAADVARAIAEVFLWHGGIAAVAWLIGFTTDSLRRALLWSMLPLAVVVFVGMMQRVAGNTRVDGPALYLGATITLFATGLVFVQFFGRRTWLTLVGVAIALVLVRYLGWFGSAWAGARSLAERRPELASEIEVRGLETWQSLARGGSSSETTFQMETAFAVSGFSAAHGVRLLRADYDVRTSDGKEVHLWSRASIRNLAASDPIRHVLSLGAAVRDEETEAWMEERLRRLQQWRQERGALPIRKDVRSEPTIFAHILLPEKLADTVRENPSACATTLTLSLTRVEKLREFRWDALGWRRFEGGAWRQTEPQAGSREGAWTARFVQAVPRSVLDAFRFDAPNARRLEVPHAYLIQRQLGQIFPLESGEDPKVTIRIFGVELLWRTMRLQEPYVRRGDRWEGYSAWRDGASIALVREKEIARFTRTSGLGTIHLATPVNANTREPSPSPAELRHEASDTATKDGERQR